MKKILVVDDERKIRAIYTKLLIMEGFEVVEASNADDANEILKKNEIDLVLLDIKMPGIDGGILYEIIQSFHRKIKVIVASVYPLIEQRQFVKDASDYYDKSQGTEILLAKIKNALDGGKIERISY